MKKQMKELDALRDRVVQMGSLAESMVHGAVSVISDPGNASTIAAVIAQEEQVDQMQLLIDKEAVRLLTVYSPVAADLRLVLSVSRITAELERIGDHANNICESLQLMASKSDSPPIDGIKKMANIVCAMVSDALTAFAQRDIEKARSTIANDDLVDALNDQIIEDLLDNAAIRQSLATSPDDVAGAMAQILVARSLERIADQATNVSEEVVYMVKGDDIRHT